MKLNQVLKGLCIIVGFFCFLAIVGDEPIGYETKTIETLTTIKVISGIVLTLCIGIYYKLTN